MVMMPLSALGPQTPESKSKNGRSVVKPEFSTAQYGASALADIQIQQPAPTGRVAARQASPVSTVVTANAIRIKGFWRENPKSQNVVSELLKTLREKSTSFRFNIPDPADPKRASIWSGIKI